MLLHAFYLSQRVPFLVVGTLSGGVRANPTRDVLGSALTLALADFRFSVSRKVLIFVSVEN